jgi:hypothetical protein
MLCVAFITMYGVIETFGSMTSLNDILHMSATHYVQLCYQVVRLYSPGIRDPE